jgi:hypothetical protein
MEQIPSLPDQVFIGGAPRSGTSIMALAMRTALPEHKTWDEGHLFDIMPHLSQAITYYVTIAKQKPRSRPNFLVSQIDPKVIEGVVADAVAKYAISLMGSSQFIDKTPGIQYIKALPLLASCFPNGKAIVMRRRGLEYMRSAEKKFGRWDEFLDIYVKCMWAISEVSRQLPNFLLVVEHKELVDDPAGAAMRIGKHLGFELDKRAKLEEVIRSRSIEKTEGSDYHPMRLNDISADEAVRADFVQKTSRIFDEFGYSYNEDYYKK